MKFKEMEKGMEKEKTEDIIVCKSFRLHLPQGRTADITVEGSTSNDCYMSALRRAAAQYPGWRSIEVIPPDREPASFPDLQADKEALYDY